MSELFISESCDTSALSGVTLQHSLLNNASFIKDLLRVRGNSGLTQLFDPDLHKKLKLNLSLVIQEMRTLELEFRTRFVDAPIYLYASSRENRNMVVMWRLSKKHSGSHSNELSSRLSNSWFSQYLSVFDSAFVQQVELYDLQRLRLNMIYSSFSHQIKLLEKNS